LELADPIHGVLLQAKLTVLLPVFAGGDVDVRVYTIALKADLALRLPELLWLRWEPSFRGEQAILFLNGPV
jgi:hypothetical protein